MRSWLASIGSLTGLRLALSGTYVTWLLAGFVALAAAALVAIR